MHQSPDRLVEERMRTAAENLKRILEELRPFESKTKVEDLSTAGTWRSWQESASAFPVEQNPSGEEMPQKDYALL